MASYGPDAATCLVLTFREGLLSAVAHDLLLRVTQFEVSVDPVSLAVSARLDASSLRVVTAMREGRPLPGALRPVDQEEIEATIRKVVLRTDRHPEIHFVSSATVAEQPDGWSVRGQLSIAGVTRDVTLPVRKDANRLVAELQLHQPDFGIQPYHAMMGALRVRPDVVVRASVPASAGER